MLSCAKNTEPSLCQNFSFFFCVLFVLPLVGR